MTASPPPDSRALASFRRLRSRVRNRLVFYGGALSSAREVGAVSCTSAIVADAAAEPLRAYPAPRAVLEVGPGTGALTRSLLKRLGAGDRLDLYEINPGFVRLLRDELSGVTAPSIEVFASDVEDLPGGARYDVIVSSLPWLNFDPRKVRRILERYEASLRPGGTISYVDYWANGVRTLIGSRRERERLCDVRGLIRAFHLRYAYRRRVIPWNVPPACVHHLTKPPGSP